MTTPPFFIELGKIEWNINDKFNINRNADSFNMFNFFQNDSVHFHIWELVRRNLNYDQ